MKKRIAVALVALVMIVGCVVGGTLAWLVDDTDPVVNTFTYGDINIELDETDADNDGETKENEYKMVPGNTIAKDPKVTVLANSEACWLFVKVEESENFGDFMTYTIADGWTSLADEDGVYYREVAASAAAQEFPVLKEDKVTVKGEVTKTQLNALTDATRPTLTFTAYAVQKDNVADAATAWDYAQVESNY